MYIKGRKHKVYNKCIIMQLITVYIIHQHTTISRNIVV